MKIPFEPFCAIEDDKVMMYMGHPKLNPTKIDVTMAFNIGLRIGSKEYDGIQTEIIK